MEGKIFAFKQDHEEVSLKLDWLHIHKPHDFQRVTFAGQAILKAAQQPDDSFPLHLIISQNYDLLPFLKIYISEAFCSALYLRNEKLVTYFLENGLNLNDCCQDALISIVYSAQYLADNPPTELLTLLLKYGANPNCSEERHRRTPLHLACKIGCLQFIKILVQNGADINAIDGKRKTPLFYCQQTGKQSIIDFVKERGGVIDWSTATTTQTSEMRSMGSITTNFE